MKAGSVQKESIRSPGEKDSGSEKVVGRRPGEEAGDDSAAPHFVVIKPKSKGADGRREQAQAHQAKVGGGGMQLCIAQGTGVY